MRRAIEAALHCARCPIIGTTCRTYARFSHPVSPFWHHRTRSSAFRRDSLCLLFTYRRKPRWIPFISESITSTCA